MKSKTMIYLEREQLKALKARARAERISLAELMRRLVANQLAEPATAPVVASEVFARIVGLGASGQPDVSGRHDEYLATAIRRDHAR
ncbi:MAG: ribbon-helix-helix protein, CopG family [Vicinamibacterales bacterium]